MVVTGHPGARVRDRRTLARTVRCQVADVAADPTTLGHVLDAFVGASHAIDRAWQADEAPRRHVISHGNFSPRTVLTNHRGLVLLDFDHLQMAKPERDLARWAAWVWVDQGARDPPDASALLGDLVSGYAATVRRVPRRPRRARGAPRGGPGRRSARRAEPAP